MQFSTSPHRPPHIYADGTWYFVTASTANRAKILSTPAHCHIWCTEMFAAVTDLRVRLAAWVLLQNHYHVLLKVRKGGDLSKLIQLVHGRTAFKFNELDGCRGRSVWHGYWDTCIRDDNDFWTRLNYIHYNAVRHGYVDRPEDWEFSSYRLHLRRAGLHDLDTHLTQKDKP